MPKPGPQVIFQPEVSQGMLRGFEQIMGAIRPTLGPNTRQVACARDDAGKMPELLDNGGLIARRIIQLADRPADVGAMFLRQALWRVHEQVGDGTATTGVMFEALYRHCLRFLASGGNAMQLQRHLKVGAGIVLEQLEAQSQPVETKAQLTQVARSLCYDAELAEALGEIFDILGPQGYFEARSGRSRHLEREYIQGAFWESKLLSQASPDNPVGQRAEIHDAYILISDRQFKDPHDLVPVFNLLQKEGGRALLIVAHEIEDPVKALLVAAQREGAYAVFAAKTPGNNSADQALMMEDLGIMTGGRPFPAITGETLEGIQLEDLGRARRAWADRNFLGIIGGKGNPGQRRAHLDSLCKALARAEDQGQRTKLERRIGMLLGGSAYLWVGAATEPELETRKALAERTSRTLRSAMRGGVVPGGGAALLACRQALLQAAKTSLDPAWRTAVLALDSALQAPFRVILHNAGYDPSSVFPNLEQTGPGYVFDVQRGELVEAEQASIWDATEVVRLALQTAIASAALALTTDVIVQHKKPRTVLEP